MAVKVALCRPNVGELLDQGLVPTLGPWERFQS
jgi:hypothetical protein